MDGIKQLLLITTLVSSSLAASALADDTAAPKPATSDAAALANWLSGVKFSGQVDAGGSYNPGHPNDGKNFGHFFDDAADEVQLNQVLLTAQRAIDPTVKDYDFGFKLQGMYGSDARYTHFLHEFQNAAGDSRNQFDIVEANVQMHAPWLSEGGIDFKAGQYPNPESAETIDPSNNYFYSHTYIFDAGVPFKNTGMLATWHTTPMIDLYAGIDSGENTSLGVGDNNSRPSYMAGIGLNLMGGNLTSVALTHIGPENATDAVRNGLLPAGVDANTALRALSDITTTWKVNDKWTLINDLNWVHDDALNAGHPANSYGIAQYGVYKINDMYSLAVRGELFRDVNGVIIAQSGNNVDYVRAQEGLPLESARSVGGGKTTYGAVTASVNIKPNLGLAYLSNVTIRPEMRYDSSLNDTKPFNDSRDRGMFTMASDIIIGF